MNIGFFNNIAILMLFVALLGGTYILQGNKFYRAETAPTQQADVLSGVADMAEKKLEQQIPCMDQGIESFSCYETYYKNFVENHGVQAAFSDLKARYSASGFVKAQCHQISHVIGHTATEFYKTPAEAFSHGDSFCWSGYYHGVMETIVENVGEEALPKTLDAICNEIPGKDAYSFDYYNCVHGLGHGIMTLHYGELFDSLDMCDTLTGEWEKSSCAGGVFMENVMSETRTGTSKFLKKDDLLYPCNAVSDAHKTQCFLMQSSHMLAVTGYDWNRVFTACASAEEPYISTCYQSIGRDASGSTVSNVEKTKNICMRGVDKAQQEGCIIGAAKDFVSYFHADVQAKQLCSTLEQSLSAICLSTVSSYYKAF